MLNNINKENCNILVKEDEIMVVYKILWSSPSWWRKPTDLSEKRRSRRCHISRSNNNQHSNGGIRSYTQIKAGKSSGTS